MHKLKIDFNVNRQLVQNILLGLFFVFVLFNLFEPYVRYESFWIRASSSDGYALGDWLINYEDGGFKRRGLSGSFFLLLSRITSISVIQLVYWSVIGCYFFFFTFLWLKLKTKKIDILFWVILLSPSGLLFIVNDAYASGRKEILIFCIGILYLYLIEKNKMEKWSYTFLISISIFILSFFHELIFFYIPYFLLISYFHCQINQKKIPYKQLFLIVISSLIPTILIFFWGGDINQGKTWEILEPYGIGPEIMEGIMSWPKEGFSSGKQNALIFAKAFHYEKYAISLALAIIPMTLFIIKLKSQLLTWKKFLLFVGMCLIFSWPIFYLTIDWGRWLNIHFIFIFLTLILFLPTSRQKHEDFKFNELVNYIKQNFNLKRYIMIGLISIYLVFNCFSWSMKHVEKGFIMHKNNTYLSLRKIFLSPIQ